MSQSATSIGTPDNLAHARVRSVAGVLSDANSTSTPLDADEEFVGEAVDVLDFASISVVTYSDVASADDGLKVEYSTNGTNWDASDAYTIDAGRGAVFGFQAPARFARVRYKNGSTPQTAFRLQTILRYVTPRSSSHRVVEAINGQDDAELVLAVLTGARAGGGYGQARLDTLDRLVVVTPSEAAGTHGFADGRVSITGTTVTAVRATAYTEPSVNAQRSFSSSSAADAAAGTGARTAHLVYYDQDLNGPFEEVVTLNGTTPVNTVASNICFIEAFHVQTAGSGGTNAGTITIHAAAAGAGGTVWSMGIGDGQTFGAHHYVSATRRCFVTSLHAAIQGTEPARFFLRALARGTPNATDLQISDVVRPPVNASIVRGYPSAIEIAGPARITAHVQRDGTGTSFDYFASFDFYEHTV